MAKQADRLFGIFSHSLTSIREFYCGVVVAGNVWPRALALPHCQRMFNRSMLDHSKQANNGPVNAALTAPVGI
jgi:hypothetical protein